MNYEIFIPLLYLYLYSRYREISAENEQVKWLWDILASFSKEELASFLRFVSGRSRLPEKLSDLPHKFQIVGADKVTKSVFPL